MKPVIPSVGNGAARRWDGHEQIAIPLAEAVIPSVSEGSPVGRHEARGSFLPTGGFLAHARNDRFIRSRPFDSASLRSASLRAGSDGEESPAGARRSSDPRRSRSLVQEQPRSSSAWRLSLGRGGFLALCGASNEPVIPSVSEESPGWVARTPSLVPPYRGSLAHARDDSLCERGRDLFIPVPTTRGAVPTLGMTSSFAPQRLTPS